MLSNMQIKLLNMLEWFDDYCFKNNITYYIAGGTLLGAVRHEGFIPWDDDIDVVVPRPDYERLISSFETGKSNYLLETPYSNNPDFLFSYSKLYDKSTTLVENVKPICKRGIYIDIFPLDGIGNDNWEENFDKFDKINMLLMTRTCSVRKGRGFIKNTAVRFMKIIPQCILNNKELSRKVDKQASRIDFDNSKYVGNLMGAYRKKEVIMKQIIGKPRKYKFENIIVNGPEKYDEYLSHIYGEWNKLPPEDKRHGSHDYLFIDLDTPFKGMEE